ncbi:putative Nuclear receptor-binding protein, partial [Naja naja]
AARSIALFAVSTEKVVKKVG